MKKQLIHFVSIMMTLTLLLVSCQIDEDFDPYNPTNGEVSAGDIVYANITAYPAPGIISTDAPTVDIGGQYSFVIDTVKAPEGSTFVKSKVSIDGETGVISYDNSANDLSLGTYLISIGITTITGVSILEDVVSITVLDVPVTLSVDNATVNSGALDVGVIATVSYTDISGEGVVTEISYELAQAVTGFSIDESTGAISKTTDAQEGANALSVMATTNVGAVTASDIVTVTVGPAPTINYFQQDGTTALAGVTVSPWTPYSTIAPTLEGMDADGGYSLILPAELDAHTDDFSVAADGVISIVADAELPDGVYSIGVTVTNGGAIAKDFQSVFTLTVETRSTEILNEDLNDGLGDTDLPETVYPGEWMNYANGSGSSWVKKVGAGGQDGFRVFRPDYQACDASLTRTFTVPAGLKSIEITWGEKTSLTGGGSHGDFFTSYDRLFYLGEDNSDIAGGTFNGSNWNIIMDANDGDWSTEAGEPEYVNSIDPSALSGSTIYLHWRIIPDPASVATQDNSWWLINYLTVNGIVAFDAEEN